MEVVFEDHHVNFETIVHFDFDAYAKYLSIYLPNELQQYVPIIIEDMIRDPLQMQIFEKLKGVREVNPPKNVPTNTKCEVGNYEETELKVTYPGEEEIIAKNLPFTGRIYIYTDQELSPEVKGTLTLIAHDHELHLRFRGPIFSTIRNNNLIPQAFISHDSRDEKIAYDIALGLMSRMCTVWYDEFSLRVGNSLRESIEKGLKQCKKCIFVLTPNFLSKGGWPKREYDSIFTRELIEERQLILPVWHNVGVEDVYAYSPILADRIGLKWELGEVKVCDQLFKSIMDK